MREFLLVYFTYIWLHTREPMENYSFYLSETNVLNQVVLMIAVQKKDADQVKDASEIQQSRAQLQNKGCTPECK